MKKKTTKRTSRLLAPLQRFSFDQLVFSALVIALVGTWAVYLALAAVSGEYGSVERDQYTRINYTRIASGVGNQTNLYTTECLRKIALNWSKQMAAQGKLSHNPNLGSQISSTCGNWYNGGENVGMVGFTNSTTSSAAIFQAFMNSADHRNNILSGKYDHVGVGAYVDASNRLWITQNFAECSYPPRQCGGNWGVAANSPASP